MEHKAGKDYKSIESLLSANFAGRPSSDISDIGFTNGLASFTILSSSSLFDSKDDQTPDSQCSAKSSQHNPTLDKPSIIVTAPHDDKEPCSKDSGDTVNIRKQPRPRRNAMTAPPGALRLFDYVPQLPRRVASARSASSNAFIGRPCQQGKNVRDPRAAEINVTIIKADMIKRPPCPTKRLPQIPRFDEQGIEDEAKLNLQHLDSLPQKECVQLTLENKNLKRLTTDVGGYCEITGQMARPFSMSTTSRELYATSTRRSIGQLHGGLGSDKVQSSGSSRCKASSSRSNLMVSLGQEKATRAPRAYLPGQIQLEEHTAQPRRDSVATLDPFDKVVESKGKRFSDMVGLENIVMYFVDFGVMEDTTEECLDRYWRDESQVGQQHTRSPTRSSAADSEESISSSPWKWRNTAASRGGSRFSSSSGSSSASQPRLWAAPMRQRIRFKNLWSPGLPGPASPQAVAK